MTDDAMIGNIVGQYASKVVSLLMEKDCVIDDMVLLLNDTVDTLNEISKHTSSKKLRTELLLASSQIQVVLTKYRKCKEC